MVERMGNGVMRDLSLEFVSLSGASVGNTLSASIPVDLAPELLVRSPTIDERDLRRFHRDRSRLIRERTTHIDRIKRFCLAKFDDKLVSGDGLPWPARFAREMVAARCDAAEDR
jgi:hypothetical protein